MVMAVLLIWVEWVVTSTIAFQHNKKSPSLLEGTFFCTSQELMIIVVVVSADRLPCTAYLYLELLL
jgi:hypothetical protein